jgi:hypothetical protein
VIADPTPTFVDLYLRELPVDDPAVAQREFALRLTSPAKVWSEARA